MKRTTIRIITIILILVLASAYPALAEDGSTEDRIQTGSSELQSIVPDASGEQDPDDLFAGYLDNTLRSEVKSSGMTLKSRLLYRVPLEGLNSLIYNELSTMIREVARGDRSSTTFEIDITAHGYDLFDYYDADIIIDRLLADMPYELYWYDKTCSTTFGTYGGMLVFNFPVAAAYSESGMTDTYRMDTSYGRAVTNTVDKVNEIVYAASELSDIEKLYYYKDTICDLANYNTYAASNVYYSYGDPWQLIWVFDEDPNTDVVCEGYAKAFKYLCDLTTFDRLINCKLITGLVGVWDDPDNYPNNYLGGHMWNTLSMDDGANYLVDITNCDEGNIGADDRLFLKGYSGIDSYGRYCYDVGNNNIVIYKYDEDALYLFSDDELKLSGSDYIVMSDEDKAAALETCASQGHNYSDWRIEKEATCTEDGLRSRTCSVCHDIITEVIPASGHSMSNWTVIREATVDWTGIKERGCELCGYSEQREIDRLIEITPTVILSSSMYVYDGSKKKPSLTVKAGSDILKKNTDYTVKYASGRRNVGRYSVKVTLKGKYTGTKTVYFKIIPKGSTVKSVISYKRALKIKWSRRSTKMSSKRITGYQIQLATDPDFTENVKKIKIKGYKSTSYKVTKLKAKRKYYVRIRTYRTANGVTCYSKWSKAKTKKTK